MAVSYQLGIFSEQAALCCSQLSQLLNHTAAMWRATNSTILVLASACSGFVLLGLGSEMADYQYTSFVELHQLLAILQS